MWQSWLTEIQINLQVYIKIDECKNLNSCVIKNSYTDCDKDVYEVLNDSIVKPLNDEMIIRMNEQMIVIFVWNEDKKIIVKYSKSEDINETSFRCVKNAHTYFNIWRLGIFCDCCWKN